MTRDEVISMAREAGMSITLPRSGRYDGHVGGNVVGLTNFAKLVAAIEREACAKLAEAYPKYGEATAEEIRARGTL